MNLLPPVDPPRLGDTLRNVLYPTAIFAAVAAVWAIGWATSLEAKASLGYWSALHPNAANRNVASHEAVNDGERESGLSSISDDGD